MALKSMLQKLSLIAAVYGKSATRQPAGRVDPTFQTTIPASVTLNAPLCVRRRTVLSAAAAAPGEGNLSAHKVAISLSLSIQYSGVIAVLPDSSRLMEMDTADQRAFVA